MIRERQGGVVFWDLPNGFAGNEKWKLEKFRFGVNKGRENWRTFRKENIQQYPKAISIDGIRDWTFSLQFHRVDFHSEITQFQSIFDPRSQFFQIRIGVTGNSRKQSHLWNTQRQCIEKDDVLKRLGIAGVDNAFLCAAEYLITFVLLHNFWSRNSFHGWFIYTNALATLLSLAFDVNDSPSSGFVNNSIYKPESFDDAFRVIICYTRVVAKALKVCLKLSQRRTFSTFFKSIWNLCTALESISRNRKKWKLLLGAFPTKRV